MAYDPDEHHRRSIRIKGYDYSRPGWYFVTICAHGYKCVFGKIAAGEMRLNRAGNIARECWEVLPRLYPHVNLDEWVIMPNHLHGIILIRDGRGGSRTAPTENRKPLGRLVGAFKTMSTKRINELRGAAGVALWQRNYYERIIRDEEELGGIRQYIRENPLRWDEEGENPVNRL